jgi:hypothetical protein
MVLWFVHSTQVYGNSVIWFYKDSGPRVGSRCNGSGTNCGHYGVVHNLVPRIVYPVHDVSMSVPSSSSTELFAITVEGGPRK